MIEGLINKQLFKLVFCLYIFLYVYLFIVGLFDSLHPLSSIVGKEAVHWSQHVCWYNSTVKEKQSQALFLLWPWYLFLLVGWQPLVWHWSAFFAFFALWLGRFGNDWFGFSLHLIGAIVAYLESSKISACEFYNDSSISKEEDFFIFF